MKKVDNTQDNKNRICIDGYTYHELPIKVNKKPFMANIATRETHKKDSKYYYHFLRDRE